MNLREQDMNLKVTSVIVIPTFNESESLPRLIQELSKNLSEAEAILVIDDSSKDTYKLMVIRCRDLVDKNYCGLHFLNNVRKGGRGNAVLQGMRVAIKKFPNLSVIIECDADLSHSPKDILRILKHNSKSQLIIGSRYLPQSEIIGWPLSRIFFSKVINFTIPKLLNLEITDVTNGLRRYSKNAITILLKQPQYNTGFIYLTEQVLHINNSRLSIEEIPIVFRNRSLGKSSVTFKEVFASILGLLKLWMGYKLQKFLKIFTKTKKKRYEWKDIEKG